MITRDRFYRSSSATLQLELVRITRNVYSNEYC